MSRKVTITTQTYFEDHFYISGWVLLVIALPLFIIKWYVGIISLLLGVIITTTSYKLIVDPGRGQIQDFLFFLGKKVNLVTKENSELDYIYIKKGRYSQQLQLRAASSVIEGTMYSAYLKTDAENLYLGQSKKKKRIHKKASKIAEELQVPLYDGEQP